MQEHAIPQNIMEYEFKLFAGLSLKQFAYIASASVLAFIFFSLSSKGIIPISVGVTLAFLILGVGILLALGSYQKRSLDQWLQLYIRAMQIPLKRVWNKTDTPIDPKEVLNSKPNIFPKYLRIYFTTTETLEKIDKNIKNYFKHKPQQVQLIKQEQIIKITPQNVHKYSVQNVKLPPIKNTVALKIIYNNKEIPGVIAKLIDSQNRVVKALRSNQSGIIYFNEPVKDGTYKITLEHPNYKFPEIMIEFKGITYPLINIIPLKDADKS